MKLLNISRCAIVTKNAGGNTVRIGSGDIVELSDEVATKLMKAYPNAWKSLDVTVDKAVAVKAIVENVEAVETIAVPCDEKVSDKKKTNSKKKK